MPSFSPDVIAAVLEHINGDHPDDTLVIARAFGNPRAESAEVVGLDENAGYWAYLVDGSLGEARVGWPEPPTERAHFRREVVAGTA